MTANVMLTLVAVADSTCTPCFQLTACMVAQVTHGLKFHAPVLCVALSPDGSQMAAGTADNTLTIRKRELKPGEHCNIHDCD
jgi:WD40 repeat protein